MKVFYHNDMDGKASAVIARKYFKENKPKLNGNDNILMPEKNEICEFIRIDYKDIFPLNQIGQEEKVYILDYSLKPELFFKLLEITRNIIWIDHHKTAIELEQGSIILKKIKGIRKNNLAACELTWKFFFNDEKVPHAIRLLGDYDIYKYEFVQDTDFFQVGVQLDDTSPLSAYMYNLLDVDIDIKHIIKQGQVAYKFRQLQYKKIIKDWSHEVSFWGYKCIACNSHEGRSKLFESVKSDYDIMIAYQFDGLYWTVKLFTIKEIDVSEIAKKYGGGGHRQAAGFVCKSLPFIVKNREGV